VLFRSKLAGIPVMFYAQGVGPVKRWTSKILIRLIADRVELITLRDEQSLAELTKLGVSRPEMLVTADPVLGFFPAGMAGYGRRLLAQFGLQKNGRPAAGIALRGWPGMERLKAAVAEWADTLANQGWDIVYIPMHYPEDLKICLDMMAAMKKPATIIDRTLTTQQTLALMGEFDLVVGMRLHALIFAAVMGVPFIGISYDPKVKQFLSMLGFEAAGEVSRIGGEELKENLFAMVLRREEYAGRLREKIPSLREKARSNAVMALELIRGRGSK
jgi:polysaccharide pyruvyl transferase CsaB